LHGLQLANKISHDGLTLEEGNIPPVIISGQEALKKMEIAIRRWIILSGKSK
jgi:hypothetical protein